MSPDLYWSTHLPAPEQDKRPHPQSHHPSQPGAGSPANDHTPLRNSGACLQTSRGTVCVCVCVCVCECVCNMGAVTYLSKRWECVLGGGVGIMMMATTELPLEYSRVVEYCV